MKIIRTQEWWLSHIAREREHFIGAGVPERTDAAALDMTTAGGDALAQARDAQVPMVFGKFVRLMRRQRALTIEALAERANLDASELLSIEMDSHYRCEPRTVFQLAHTFGVPMPRLSQLAGHTTEKNVALQREALRFAARSESVEALSAEELHALEEFVAVLADPSADLPP